MFILDQWAYTQCVLCDSYIRWKYANLCLPEAGVESESESPGIWVLAQSQTRWSVPKKGGVSFSFEIDSDAGHLLFFDCTLSLLCLYTIVHILL